ncbi:phage portal protein family protein [Brumimicrobium mesophilum]|uniref:phage portal protein family protein n=1 Tax=Brumimicrobium mesophilum TaxID=392717 RepID=UPI000D14394A|nr:DUF935 family protein [Brumimicrobium mesophilum]
MELFNKVAQVINERLGTIQPVQNLKAENNAHKEITRRVLNPQPKAVARTRIDLKMWNQAILATEREEDPRNFALQDIFTRVMDDGLLTSQIENRQTKMFSLDWNLKTASGEIDEVQTEKLKDAGIYRKLTKHAANALYFGYSLVEIGKYKDIENVEQVSVKLIPRANVVPQNGRFYPDVNDDKFILYREMREFGTFLLEFVSEERGLINKSVKHVLMKDFAQSCWAELCEIYGIPPRFMKTDTRDPAMLKRAEAMMTDMGAAAWFIIDEHEEFEFADGVSSSGDVYNELIKLCNNEMSMLISGAIIAQDTVNGNRSKDESAQDVLWEKVMEDIVIAQDYWNKTILPALKRIGFITGDVKLRYDIPENLDELWKKVIAVMQYAEVDLEWVEEKFDIKIIGKREVVQKLKADDGLFL